MDSFFSLLKRHFLKLWLVHLLGMTLLTLAKSILTFTNFLVGEYLFSLASVHKLQAFDVFLYFFHLPETSVGSILCGTVSASFLCFILSFNISSSYGICIDVVTENRASLYSYFYYGLDFIHKMFWVYILFMMGLIPIPVLLTLFLILSKPVWIKGILIIMGILFIVLYYSSTLYVPLFIMAEKTTVWESIKYSMKLARHSFGQVFLTGALVLLLSSFGTMISILLNGTESLWAPASKISSLKELFEFVFPIKENLLLIFTESLFTLLSSYLYVYRYFRYLRPHIQTELVKVNSRSPFDRRSNHEY